MKKHFFYIKSMGCKSNQFEGDIIKGNMIKSGFVYTSDINQADYYILNSCSVTHKSDNETLYTLRNIKHLHPNIKTVLTGCVAQLESYALSNYDYIDFIFGNDDKFLLGNLLLDNVSNKVTNIMSVENFNYQELFDTSKTRYSLKIQDGCDNRCAYCVIPYARGKSRSASSEFIIEQINMAASVGFKEVVLTGIHIGQWGKDIDKQFVDLIFDIEKYTDIPRFRLGSLNPLEITNDLLDVLETSDKFCPHFHLSLQSACNKTLKSMNRFYTVEKYLEQIEDITKRFELPFIGSDIITGFPNESDADFEITVNNLKQSKLTKIHTFPYSIRKGTQAETMPGHLPDSVKQHRAEIVKNISKQKYSEFALKNIDKTHQILIEKRPDKNSGLLKGVTENYLNVIIEANITDKEPMFNTLKEIVINKYDNDKFWGTLI